MSDILTKAEAERLNALMIACGRYEKTYRDGGPWGDAEESALKSLLDAAVDAYLAQEGK